MEEQLKKAAKSSYLNDLTMSEEKKSSMFKDIKSSPKKQYHMIWLKTLAGSLACAAIFIILATGSFNNGILTNSTQSLSETKDSRYTQPLSIAESTLPEDLVLPTPFFEVIKEPIVKYSRIDGEIWNFTAKFEGEDFYMTLRLHQGEDLFEKTASFEETPYKKKNYLNKKDGEQMMLIYGIGEEYLIYEHNGYYYRISVFEKIWKNEKQYNLVQSTKKHLRELRENLY